MFQCLFQPIDSCRPVIQTQLHAGFLKVKSEHLPNGSTAYY